VYTRRVLKGEKEKNIKERENKIQILQVT